MTGLTQLRAALKPLPDGALVPVSWIRGLLGERGDFADPAVEEVAEALGRAPSTIRGWCRGGQLPGAYRCAGREWRIPRESLRALRRGEPEGGRGPSPRNAGRSANLSAWRGHREPEANK